MVAPFSYCINQHVVCIGALAIVSFFQLSETDFLTIAPLIPMLYQKVVLPMALITIIQGIIYGVFTNWGFFKHKWVLFTSNSSLVYLSVALHLKF